MASSAQAGCHAPARAQSAGAILAATRVPTRRVVLGPATPNQPSICVTVQNEHFTQIWPPKFKIWAKFGAKFGKRPLTLTSSKTTRPAMHMKLTQPYTRSYKKLATPASSE
eukprot:scaffold4593_cov125-Isochrysis_galbana.AAC.3